MTTKEENIRLIFGLKIRQLRMDKRLSLSEISKASGISISYLNEIEKGKKYPKANKIAQLAKTLDVSYDWLVSLQLTKNLRPIAELLRSDLLTNLPLEIFGIEPSDLIDVISNTPSKISAFITTLIELARNYNISVENFYFAVLRSYQEMHENYFEDIEDYVEKFVQEHPEFLERPISLQALKDLLINRYNYMIDEEGLSNYPELISLRTVLIPGNPNRLLVNKFLNDTQRRFTLGREIGYNFMKLKQRSYTSSWVAINSFEEILSNFKASYFSGALMIPKTHLYTDLVNLIAQDTWQSDRFMAIMEKYTASPEMFMHRLTSLMPKFFNLNQLFFLRFSHKKGSNRFELDKEFHLAGLYNPHSNMLDEHYCRRWVSLKILMSLAKMQSEGHTPDVICEVQRSQYIDSDNEFFCISLARAFAPTPHTNSSVTIGFLMNDDFKRQVKFWDDPNIPIVKVGVTCERCSDIMCEERATPPSIYQGHIKSSQVQQSLEKLRTDYQSSKRLKN